MKLVQNSLGPSIDGASPLDVTVKGIARIATSLQHALFLSASNIAAEVLYIVLVTGATLHMVRLYADMAANVIYSV
jgi:hypothetical protein